MKRRFRLGPGTLVALTAAIVIAYVKWPATQRRAAERQRMNELRAQVAQRQTRPAPRSWTLDEILQHGAELKLTEKQIVALQRLRSEEENTASRLQRDLKRASHDFQKWMDEAKKRGGVTLSDLQRHSVPLREASAAVAGHSREFSTRARLILTPAQREQLKRTSQ